VKSIIIISAFLLLGGYGFGQENTTQFVDIIPLFNGADEETNYVKTKAYFDNCNLTLLADEEGINIGVSFIINSTGIATSPILIFGNDSTMFNAVIKCMKNTPKWIPASKDGANVSCRFNFAFEK